MKQHIRSRHEKYIKKERNLLVGIIIAVVVLITIVIALQYNYVMTNPQILKGTWQYTEYMSFDFGGDGYGHLYLGELVYDFEYFVKNKEVKLDFENDAVSDCVYEFSIEKEDILVLVGGNGTENTTYKLQRK